LRRFGRQLIVTEVGESGQAALIGSCLYASETADSASRRWARDYLERAGCEVATSEVAVIVPVLDSTEVDALAGEPEYRAIAELLAGAHAAVEALKSVLDLPEAPPLDISLHSAPKP